MSELRRLVLVRHGETEGNSSVRFLGSTDSPLSEAGRAQMQAARAKLGPAPFDVVVASPLRRAWQAARILAGDVPVRLEADLREVHFGRWEGLAREEIRAQDPVLFEAWQSRADGFRYPGGESREEFRQRVEKALERLLAGSQRSALVAVHKGVVRTFAEKLLGEPLADDDPALEIGGVLELTRSDDGWFRGRHSSDPPALRESA